MPVRYDLTANLIDARVRYFDFLPPMVADADLALGGPPDGLLLSGDIRIQDMVFSERVDWEQWAVDFREQQLSGLVAEVDDDEAFCDLDLIADGQLDANLRLIRSTARPGMVGEVRMLSGGRMFHEDREFVVTRAELHYVDPGPGILNWTLSETDISSRDRSCHVTPARERPLLRLAPTPARSWTHPWPSPTSTRSSSSASPERRHRARGRRRRLGYRMEGLRPVVDRREPARLERLATACSKTPTVSVTGVNRPRPLVSLEWRVLSREADQPARRRHAHRRVQPLPAQRPVPRRREAARPQRLSERVLGELPANET
ncbi:MAG: hypothetical protein IPN01_16380 [Deltaproteobacteria bacterium]|nr:hypothetical protein [Deltaproteobacteria bacterium]